MATAYLAKWRLLRRDVILFLIAQTLLGITGVGINWVALNLYLLRLGFDPPFIGLVHAASMATWALLSLPAGVLGGRWGSRRAMIGGLVLSGGAWVLSSQAELIPTSLRPGWLLATCVLASVGMVLYFVNFAPFLMARTGLAERDHAFSAFVALEPLGGFAGSLLGGLLPGLFAGILGVSAAAPGPFRLTLLTAALLLVPAILLLLATSESPLAPAVEQPVEERPAKGGPAPVALIAAVALCLALWLAGRSSADTFFNVYLDTTLAAPTGLIGALQGIGQLVAVPAVLVMPLLVARWGQIRIIIFGGLAAALGLLLLGLIPHWSAAGFGLMALTACFSITNATVIVYGQEIVEAGWRETMSGALNAAGGFGLAAMALMGGHAILSVGYRGVFLMGMGCMVAGALLFWIYFPVRHAELGGR